ncbi:MAG: dihydroxyacetone kinase subunit L [Anaerolineae bacterium]|nr:dihydroxyacetone kinase subunit L [Anaerolineae bacterium]
MITKPLLTHMLLSSATKWIEQSDAFSELDARFGDGDHGVTMKKIALHIQTALENWQDQSIKQFIDELGTAVMGIGGGSAGPLWGTLIGGLALPLADDTASIDGDLLKTMLASALDEMQSISTAKVGDKTLMDALIPAVEAAQNCSGDINAILNAAATAARQGAENTANFAARFGRAKNYKEQSIGTPDAGAISLTVFFEGLASGAN